MLIRWLCRTAFAALLIWGQPAHALQEMVCDRLYVYFPEGEAQLAARIMAQCESMTAFLEAQNLSVSRPLHVILDDKLDEAKVRVSMIPHKEIRLSLKAPGVLEDGYTEPDPWRYNFFMGMCALGIYGERSGIPGKAHKIFGEIASPNLILPEWGVDGVSYLLYEMYVQRPVADPLAHSIFDSGPIPQLDEVSNHPEIWPGRFTYRIYGRPFIRWLYDRYGWSKLFAVLQLHGAGIIPVEIDTEARRVFGMSWNQLWQVYRSEHSPSQRYGRGLPMNGYWADPFVYWNESGVYPGRQSSERRGRYGYMDDESWLWLSRYDKFGAAQITKEQGDAVRIMKRKHVWDPGPGSVAVTRKGSRPYLLISDQFLAATPGPEPPDEDHADRLIAAPPGVLQMSGPVMDSDGRIAVAANMEGNWDIWLYDGTWYQVTRKPSVELDPWLENGTLVFASNASGRFQIHSLGMRQLTQAPIAALFPRSSTYLELGVGGWQPMNLVAADLPTIPDKWSPLPLTKATPEEISGDVQPYSAWKSIKTNYLIPSLFYDVDNFQFGIATAGRDMTGDYVWDAGIRYIADSELFTWRLGGQVKDFNGRATRYPFGLATPGQPAVNELRHDFKMGWTPARLENLDLSVNYRHWVPDNNDELADEEWWVAAAYTHTYRNIRARLNADLFNNGSQSFFADVLFWFGQRIETVLHLQGGKTWGELVPGHNTFRVGGNSGEGFFTQRPSRLFPLRGFDADIQDAGQAAVGSLEIYWPLARLQTGYKTLPLFLRNIGLGTFMDSGMAAEDFKEDELLVSAGFELITGMELAWGIMADFRLGVAWPLVQPDYLHQSGPVFLIQFGQPL